MRALRTVCFDATHSVQYPGGGDSVTGGQREFVHAAGAGGGGGGGRCPVHGGARRPAAGDERCGDRVATGELEGLLLRVLVRIRTASG